MIEARGLTKRYGDKLAVDGLTFTVRPGMVTGFLGPNGAGKSTTMRMILGLDAPTQGSVTVNGRPYREHAAPLREVGALLDARSVHPGRSAYHHLLALAQTCGIRRSRVDEVVDAVGLGGVARRRAGGFSLGMGQRLGIAAALLGDPAHGDPRRAGERPGHRGHPLDPVAAPGPRRRGPDGLRLVAPDERDGADRPAPDRHRPGPADRRHRHGGVRRPRRPRRGPGAQHRPRRAGGPAPLAGRGRRRGRGRQPGRVRAHHRPGRHGSPGPPGSPCSSSPPSRPRWRRPSST